ncbi:MAG: ribonuclease P protein component [Rubrivivax sp.]|nr:ribonuclease P protein component [Rubrivivax sp.]
MDRLVNKADFERLLATRSCSRSAHFALHHVAAGPQAAAKRGERASSEKLSTAPAPGCQHPVDDSLNGHWFGCVVPKRYARRAVTRNLFKRQARSAFERHACGLPAGLWLVRLRAPFTPATFVSARSAALAAAARGELDGLFGPASR